MSIENITTREQLMAFVERTGLSRWHEPDEHDVDAVPAVGYSFDNAFCNPEGFELTVRQSESGHTVAQATVNFAEPRSATIEHGVFLLHDGEPVAFVNLAMLFAFATGMAE